MHACSVMSDSVIPWTVACQAALSMGFSRQGYYWSQLPFPPPGDLPNPGIESASPVSPALAGRFFLPLSHLETPPKCLRRYSYLLFHIKCVYVLTYTHRVNFLAHTYYFHLSLACCLQHLLRLFNCQESPPNCQIPLDLSVVSDSVVSVIALKCSFYLLLSRNGLPFSLTEATMSVEPDYVQIALEL